MFDSIKDVRHLFLASARIFSRLGVPVSTARIVYASDTRKIPTNRRTPIPAKIAFAGGNA